MKRISVLFGVAMLAILACGCGEGGEPASTSPAGNAASTGKVDENKPGGSSMATSPAPEPPPK